jgi:hypothetical protein
MPSTPVTDTTSKTINGKDGTADFTLDTAWSGGSTIVSYKCILDMMRIREIVEMTSADTFCIEGSADQDPGRSQVVGEISGIGKKGGPASGPLIPSPQNVPIVMTFSTSCTLTMNANFTEADCTRLVNANCRIGGRFLSKPGYVLSWKLTTP